MSSITIEQSVESDIDVEDDSEGISLIQSGSTASIPFENLEEFREALTNIYEGLETDESIMTTMHSIKLEEQEVTKSVHLIVDGIDDEAIILEHESLYNLREHVETIT